MSVNIPFLKNAGMTTFSRSWCFWSIVIRVSIVGRLIKVCVHALTSPCVAHSCLLLSLLILSRCLSGATCQLSQKLSKCSVSVAIYTVKKWCIFEDASRIIIGRQHTAYVYSFLLYQAVVGVVLRYVRDTRGSLIIFFRLTLRWDLRIYFSFFLSSYIFHFCLLCLSFCSRVNQ